MSNDNDIDGDDGLEGVSDDNDGSDDKHEENRLDDHNNELSSTFSHATKEAIIVKLAGGQTFMKLHNILFYFLHPCQKIRTKKSKTSLTL